MRAGFSQPSSEHVFLYRVTYILPSVQFGQMYRCTRFSPVYLSMPMQSPWNQSSHWSQAIMNRWLSGPRQMQYGPLSDSSDSSPSPVSPAASASASALASALALFVFFDAALGFFAPPFPRLDAFTMLAVPFFFFAVAEAGAGWAPDPRPGPSLVSLAIFFEGVSALDCAPPLAVRDGEEEPWRLLCAGLCGSPSFITASAVSRFMLLPVVSCIASGAPAPGGATVKNASEKDIHQKKKKGDLNFDGSIPLEFLIANTHLAMYVLVGLLFIQDGLRGM